MTEVKAMARLEILNHIVSSSTALRFGEHHQHKSSCYFTPMERDEIVIGSLVSLQSAPKSKWYLSWLVEYIPSESSMFSDIFVLESIEDGELCNWSNVSLNKYVHWDNGPPPQRWRWTDKQFEFSKRWHRQEDFKVRTIDPVFDGNSVTLDTRIRHNWTENKAEPKTFDNWKKLKVKDLKEYMNECIAANK